MWRFHNPQSTIQNPKSNGPLPLKLALHLSKKTIHPLIVYNQNSAFVYSLVTMMLQRIRHRHLPPWASHPYPIVIKSLSKQQHPLTSHNCLKSLDSLLRMTVVEILHFAFPKVRRCSPNWILSWIVRIEHYLSRIDLQKYLAQCLPLEMSNRQQTITTLKGKDHEQRS